MEIANVTELVTSLQKREQIIVSEIESKEILRAWGMPVPPCVLADNPDEAALIGERLGYPLALKVHSSAIVHKTDAGGVKLDLWSAEDVKNAFNEIETTCSPLDSNFKVLVQPMSEPGLEVILGVSPDPQFGPALMFGMGGVFVELYKDVCFRLLPIKKKDAIGMIASIRAFPLLKGYRGKPGIDIEYLAELLMSISELVTQYPAISEIDLNPLILYPHGAAVIDARMVLKDEMDMSKPV